MFVFIIAHRKLAAHDKGSQLAVHVAMDMLVVIDDLSKSIIGDIIIHIIIIINIPMVIS